MNRGKNFVFNRFNAAANLLLSILINSKFKLKICIFVPFSVFFLTCFTSSNVLKILSDVFNYIDLTCTCNIGKVSIDRNIILIR